MDYTTRGTNVGNVLNDIVNITITGGGLVNVPFAVFTSGLSILQDFFDMTGAKPYVGSLTDWAQFQPTYDRSTKWTYYVVILRRLIMKKVIIILLSGILLMMIVLLMSYTFFLSPSDIQIINKNWSINLPKPYKHVYTSKSEESFIGDGEKYTVFEYRDLGSINQSLHWNNGPNPSIELEVTKITNDLNVSIIPNFKRKYKYYSIIRNDSSRLYLLFDIQSNKLYVVEYII